MRGLQWIILAIVAVNVIGAIVKGLSKTQQKEREEALAAQRRHAAMQQGQPRQASGGPGGQGLQAGGEGSGRYPTGRPLDALAQRRKEQLEQLRQRRRQKASAGPVRVQVSAPPSPRAIPTKRAGLAGPRLESLADKMEKAKRAEARLQERREAAARAQMQQPPAPRAREAVRPVAVPEPEQARAGRRPGQRLGTLASSEEAGPGEEPKGGRGVELARSVKRSLGSRATLRELFVLKELLDRPISLRQAGLGE